MKENIDLTKESIVTIVKGNGYREIRVEGHNQDLITCAGLSAIVETAELGLKALANSTKGVTIVEEEI